MRFHFLGGADEIGASCLLVETSHSRFLLDCGVRQGAKVRDPLPDLARIQDQGGIDAILVTHAHFDHTGALPLVHASYPKAPVLMTAPTKQLASILLTDSLKIMGHRAEAEGDIPLYAQPAVDSLLSCVKACRFYEPEEPVPGIEVTFFPAGHILGAASIGIETDEGRLLVAGDVSVSPQLTIDGMLAPRFKADTVVMESTYGDRLHANRESEERRLAETVGEVVAGGGKVLIPAFAIGRAQEVIMILRRAITKKWLTPFPIYVDGMVRAVCEAYTGHPEWVSERLRRRIERKGNPFWGEDEWIRPVKKPEERDGVLRGAPCCIVTSSGMLTGGPSSFYATALASDPKSLIAITGYQDEESPGRKLLELAEGKSRELTVSGQKVEVSCRVATYSLSAHADSGEIAGLVSRIKPKDLILVHGEGESRPALASKVTGFVREGLHLPSLGDRLELEYGKSRHRVVVSVRERSADNVAIGPETLTRLASRIGLDPLSRAYDLSELARRCLDGPATAKSREALRVLLLTADSPVEPDRKRPFLFRRRSSSPEPSGERRDEAGRLEQNEAMNRVDRLFGPGLGLHRKGVLRETWQIILYFDFPIVAIEEHRDRIEELSKDIGWEIVVHPETNLGRLAEVVQEVTPVGWSSGRAPAVHREERRVVAWTPTQIPLDSTLMTESQSEFLTRTGFRLEFRSEKTAPPDRARPLIGPDGKLEINQSYAFVRKAFAQTAHHPRRLGLKTDATGTYIEVGFISPQVGARYRGLLDEIERQIGWRLALFPRADQQAILQEARQILPGSWVVRKGPGLDLGATRIHVTLASQPDPDEIREVEARLVEATGFSLNVEQESSGSLRMDRRRI